LQILSNLRDAVAKASSGLDTKVPAITLSGSSERTLTYADVQDFDNFLSASGAATSMSQSQVQLAPQARGSLLPRTGTSDEENLLSVANSFQTRGSFIDGITALQTSIVGKFILCGIDSADAIAPNALGVASKLIELLGPVPSLFQIRTQLSPVWLAGLSSTPARFDIAPGQVAPFKISGLFTPSTPSSCNG
jgi:hypothetical protein